MPACVHGVSPLGACSTCTPPAPAVSSGTAAVDVDGTTYPVRVTRQDHLTFVEMWQESAGTWVRTVLQPAPGGALLSEDERRYLAMHARYESNRQDDVRYWDPDPQKRLALKRRWREIADWLHPEPWGEQPTPQRVALAGVEDGRITAWNAGHVRPVRVLRDTAGETPMVECPDCEGAATVDGHGDIRCGAVPGCGGGWRVAVGAVYADSDDETGR